MDIRFADRIFPFQAWKPSLGTVIRTEFSFDCETTLISEAHPQLIPAYVLGAAFDGQTGYFVSRDHAAAFWAAHTDVPIVFHSAAFDLSVVNLLSPALDVYAAVDAARVWDTRLMHQLHALATDGHPATRPGESTLEACARTYLGVDLSKDGTDADGRPVRTSYGRWLGRPPSDIPPVYLRYLATDVIATFRVYGELRRRIDALREPARRAWGFVSDDWLAACWGRWGPLAHNIQVKAAVVLAAITRNGLHIDLSRRDDLVAALKVERDACAAGLRDQGVLVKGAGSQKALQAKLKRLATEHPDVSFPRTESGQYATDADTLHDLADAVPFVGALLKYRTVDKLLASFVDKLARPVVRPSFGVLTRTGRTSSFGELNAQNLPKDDRVRNCFVPSPGHVYLDLDFAAIELAALAQVNLSQFGGRSVMAERINAGDDLHRTLAGFVTGKPPAEVTKDERQRAKAINFGKPGGMGDRALQAYARHTYGADLTDEQVRELSATYLSLFPEMVSFLADDTDVPARLADAAGLTPLSHFEATGDERFLRHPANAGRCHLPHPILGAMALKVLGWAEPTTRAGTSYSPADVEYFWSRLQPLADPLPTKWADALRDRKPSGPLRRAVTGSLDRRAVFTLTGRLRAAAGYTERHNTVFQGLTSDGAKLALWKVWRAGHRIVNFVHDELLVEVPATADLTAAAEAIKGLMIAGMKEVLPDIRVQVEYAATDRWDKRAVAEFDDSGRLVPWQPGPSGDAPGATAPAPAGSVAPRAAGDAVTGGTGHADLALGG